MRLVAGVSSAPFARSLAPMGFQVQLLGFWACNHNNIVAARAVAEWDAVGHLSQRAVPLGQSFRLQYLREKKVSDVGVKPKADSFWSEPY
jgi:hypothetical protein